MKSGVLLPVLLALSACVPSRVDSTEVLVSLVRAERAFANASVSSTTRAAFLRYLGAGAVLFNNGPTDGRALWEASPEVGGVLAWGPEIADVASAGDMGYTSGPWEWRAKPDTAAARWGHFVSVWEKDANGEWKVAADGGVAHGPADLPGEGPVERAGGMEDWAPSPDGTAVEVYRSTLLETDGSYSQSVAERGFPSTIEEFVHPSARFFRNGALPIVGIAAISASAYVTEAVWDEWDEQNATISASCDLGFSYGVVRLGPDPSRNDIPGYASYYRIWRRHADTEWKVVVDVLIPFLATSE